jgi:ribonuclease HI
MTPHPRLTRQFAYPLSDKPKAAAVGAVEDLVLPLGPPSHVWSDPVLRKTIDDHPDLFKRQPYTPYDVDAFRKALVTGPHPYPHREVAEAFLFNLEHGFWPCHSGDFSMISSFDYDKSKEDWAFVEEQGHKGFEQGRMSVAFKVRPPGTSFNPTFVRTPESGAKKRWIIDCTGSKINAEIAREDVSPVYDMVADFFRICRYILSRPTSERRRILATFKDDFADAFWGLAVCAEWQVRQLLHFVDAEGEEYFRVDWRLQFGNRSSPYLWSSCCGFVLWIAQEHYGLEHPMGYVDDLPGADGKEGFVRRSHLGKEFLVPIEQSKLLDAFDLVGAPYKVEKQINNLDQETGEVDPDALLTILGFDYSPRDLTFTIPEEWKVRFLTSSARFKKGVALPLPDWRSWLGKANYAAVIVPHVRWRLNLLHKRVAKLELDKGAEYPRIKYRVKDDEEEAIEAFSAEVASSVPMSIFDAVLQIWPKNAMDVVVYSDSCGLVDGGKVGGIGILIQSPKHLGLERAFAYRHDREFVHNNVAEGAAVYLAFLEVVKLVPQARRVLFYSDSTDVVYAIDAGKGEDELNRLAMRMRVLSSTRKIDFRVRWIKGTNNDPADRLSRRPLNDLHGTYGDRLSIITVDDYVLEGAC